MKIYKVLEFKKAIGNIFQEYKNVYIYGAGLYSKILISCITGWGFDLKGIFVSNPDIDNLNGIPVHKYDKYQHYEGAIIMALNSKYHGGLLEYVGNSFDYIGVFPDDLFHSLNGSKGISIKTNEGWCKCEDLEYIDRMLKKRTIVFQRSGGMGDALILEPICRKFKQLGYQVGVITHWGEMFKYCDSVDLISDVIHNKLLRDNCLYISVDNSYEVRPFQHILDSYLDVVREFFPNIVLSGQERIPIYDTSLIHRHNKIVKKICMNIEASKWKSRIFDQVKMKAFVKYLLDKGYIIYEIGLDRNNYLGIGIDSFNLCIHDTVKLMSETDMYIGMDNGLMHLAQAINLPVFIMFGSVCPVYRLHDWSKARVLWKNIDSLPCAGCYHRVKIPCDNPVCLYDSCKCLEWTVNEVIEAFENLQYNMPPKVYEEMHKPLWNYD